MSGAPRQALISVDDYLDAVIPLAEIGTELPLAEIYDGAEFVPEPEDET
jgi:hypothetical protein